VLEALGHPFRYVEPPRLDDKGRFQAALAGPGDGATVSVTITPRASGYQFNLSAACSCGAESYRMCSHVEAILADLAACPAIRDALLAGEDAAPLLDRLPALRVEARRDYIARSAIGAWAPREPRPAAPALSYFLSVHDTLSDHGGWQRAPSWGQHPLLEVRARLPGEKRIATRADLDALRLATFDAEIVRRVADVYGRKGFSASGDAAALVLHLLRDRAVVSEEATGRAVTFARAPALLRVVRTRMARGKLGQRSTTAAHPHRPEHHAPARIEAPTPFDLEEVPALEARWFSRDGALDEASADVIFFAGLYPCLWVPRTATVHPVPLSLGLEAAWRFFVTPSVEITVGRGPALFRALRGYLQGSTVALPPAAELGLAPAERPALRVRIDGEPLALVLALEAEYSAGTFVLVPGAHADDAASTRDLPLEAAALERVARLGLPFSARDGGFAAQDDDAARFWTEGVAALREADEPPLELVIPAKLARVGRARKAAGRVRVACDGNWFEATVGADVDGAAVDLPRLWAAIATGKRWVALDDGSLAEITSELAELLADSRDVVDAHGHGRLPVHQVGRLDRWLDAPAAVVEISPAARALRERLLGDAALAEPEIPPSLRATLRPYQRVGLAWLQRLGDVGAGGVLADDMGLGKTLMTLAFLEHLRLKHGRAPSLVVCPTSVAGNWLREAAAFCPELRTALLHGADREAVYADVASFDLVVTTYGLLRRDLDRLAAVPFRAVILDEAQGIKNAAAATAKAARSLQATVRLALTGTPVENRLAELWSIADFTNPGMLGTRAAFGRTFEGPIASDRQGPAARRLRALLRPFLLRRTKRQVLGDLPPKQEVDVPCALGPAQRALYDATAALARDEIAARIRADGFERSHLALLTALLRLRQIACDPRLVPGLGGPSAKRAMFLEIVRELVAEGRRALVFSQFVQFLTLLRHELDREAIAYEYLDGATVDRDAAVARFQQGDAPLFLISLKAGGSGLNLTAADTVIHCDPWWNPAVEDQATDRAHRIGQARAVTVYRLVARGTVEDKIMRLKAAKRALSEAVIADTGEAMPTLSEADVGSLLGAVEGPLDAEDVEDEEAAEGPALEALTAAGEPGGASLLEKVKGAAVEELGRTMQAWLDRTGKKQKHLAALVGVSSYQVGRLLRGAVTSLPAQEAERIRRALGE
jgi:superfamily II DNA or RNA helicase